MVNIYTRLLAAVLLIMAGLSAGLRHAHQGGETSHHHDDAEYRLIVQGTQLAPGGSVLRDAPGWFSAPLHMHVYLLGFQFTVPAEEEGGDTETDAGDHLVVVRLLADELSNPASHGSAAVEMLAAISAAPGQVVAAAIFRETPVERVRTLPLCDRARHERSGVQLA